MTRTLGLALAAASALGGTAALAQDSASDVRYCSALASTYTRYVGTSQYSSRQPADSRTDPEARLALAQCHDGRARQAIPVLERRLGDARVELPRRD